MQSRQDYQPSIQPRDQRSSCRSAWLPVAMALGLLAAFAAAVPVAAGGDAARSSAASGASSPGDLSRAQDVTYTVFVPIVLNPPPTPECPVTSSNSYTTISANKYDQDNPVRPAGNHADKNLALRSYALNTGALIRGLVDYGCDDCPGGNSRSPQFTTLFSPNRIPAFTGFYRVYGWDWQASPLPGTRSNQFANNYRATALGLQTVPGESLRVPDSGYNIGEGKEVMVLFADADSIALRYTREDSSGSPGYTVHVDKICTDPNLLAVYNSSDNPSGPRYIPDPSYPLPALAAGQAFGTARGSEVVVAIADTGNFMDPRSCKEFWKDWANYALPCPAHD